MKNVLITLGILFGLLWIVASGSCINKVKNMKIPLEFIFERGSTSEELTNFVNDMKTTYPEITVGDVLTDEDAFNEAVKFHNIQPEKIEEYRKTLTTPYDALPSASISIKASANDIGTEKQFKNFVSQEFNKYKSLKLRQDSGSGGDRIADFFVGKNFNKQACFNPRYSISRLLSSY